jgi:tetratricopeptide (TPR) repeat protein
MSEKTLLKALFHRRVPQILGLYLGAAWIAIEFSDMIVDRYGLGQTLVDFLLVLLASFVPTVLMLAWFHGAPGRDEWTRVEKIGIPLNILLCIGLLVVLFRGEELGATTTTVTVTDEEGQQVERVVARPELRRRIAVFFLENRSDDPELDWLQYGLAVGLAKNLGQNMFVSVWTPYLEYESRGFIEFRQAGYPDGLGAPLALMQSIARKKRRDYFVKGYFERSGDEFSVGLEAYRASDAKSVFSERLSGPDVVPLADRLEDRLEEALDLPADEGRARLAMADRAAESPEALRHAVLGLNAEHMDNDLEQAVGHWRRAVEIEPSFAAAHMNLASAMFQLGDVEAAVQALGKALQHDYLLTDDEKFIAKGMNYTVRGQIDKGIRLYEMWAELYPQNTLARKYLAAAYEQLANRPADALAQIEAVYELDPDDDRVLLWMGRLQEVLGDVDAAIELYGRYAASDPEDQTALIEMAEALIHVGRLDEARERYERAELLDPGSVTPVVGLAQIALRVGQYDDARRHLEVADSVAQLPQQADEVVRGRIGYRLARGQPAAAIDLVDRLYEVDSAYMQPINLLMMTHVHYARAYAEAGQTTRGVEILSRLQAGFEPPLDGLADVGFMLLWTAAGDAGKLAEYTDKVDAFLRSLQQERFYYSVDMARARLAELGGDLEQALASSRAALANLTSSVSVVEEIDDLRRIRLTLADYLIRTGKLDEAAAVLDRQLAGYPADPLGNLRLAELERARGRTAQARQALSKSLDAYGDADPGYAPAMAVRRLAAELGAAD